MALFLRLGGFMGRTKTNNCNHAYYRASERFGWDKKKAEEMMRIASKKGISPFSMQEGALKDLYVFRQLKTKRRIRIYQGFVFIFASTSTRCYTVYKLQEESEV